MRGAEECQLETPLVGSECRICWPWSLDLPGDSARNGAGFAVFFGLLIAVLGWNARRGRMVELGIECRRHGNRPAAVGSLVTDLTLIFVSRGIVINLQGCRKQVARRISGAHPHRATATECDLVAGDVPISTYESFVPKQRRKTTLSTTAGTTSTSGAPRAPDQNRVSRSGQLRRLKAGFMSKRRENPNIR